MSNPHNDIIRETLSHEVEDMRELARDQADVHESE